MASTVNAPTTRDGGLTATGTAVILKPSQITPGVGEWLACSWERAVPERAGASQNLVGFAASGQSLTAAGVDKVAFTGSVRSGRAVAAGCAPRLTPKRSRGSTPARTAWAVPSSVAATVKRSPRACVWA
jgi:acyl-CoA reductase-like NAD-dependent aldehyde dehydrogenase